MPVFEYVLVALLGAAGATSPEMPGGPSMRTLTADIVTQPSGGTEGLLGQATSGSPSRHADTGRKGRRHVEARRRHRRHKHRRVNTTGKKPSKI
jgi:hypothetical protein